MKNVFLSAAALFFFSLTSHSQIQKGNVLVGGDLANFDLGLDKGSYFSLNITPKAAWFIKDNIAVGAYVNLGVVTAKNSNTLTTYGIGSIARYYFTPEQVSLLKHTRLFGEGNVGVEGSNVSHGPSTNGLGLGFGPGITYFITPSIGLEGLLKYNGIVGFGSDGSSNKLALNFGFQVYLPGKSTKNKVMNDMKG